MPKVYKHQTEESIIPEEEQVLTETLTVPELISYYSNEYGISDEVPLAIANAESGFVNVCNHEIGCRGGIGIFQIVQSTFDGRCEGTPYNIEDNVNCGVKMIKAEEYWRWNPSMHNWINNVPESLQKELSELCNCITGLRSFGVDVAYSTDAEDLISNSTPHIGGVVIFEYSNGKHHGALIIDMTDEYMIIKETNYRKCQLTTRKIYYSDPSIKGFYDPKG